MIRTVSNQREEGKPRLALRRITYLLGLPATAVNRLFALGRRCLRVHNLGFLEVNLFVPTPKDSEASREQRDVLAPLNRTVQHG